MGCPTSYDGKSATWSKGKLSRLSSGTLASGTTSYVYNYNAFGQRVSKSYSYLAGTSGLNPVQTGQVTAYSKKYYYDHAGRLLAEGITKTVHGTGTVNERIVFLYDESSMVGMERTASGVSTLYYFQRNLQGDVTAIVDINGNIIARYLYDAWGNCTVSSDTTNTAVANANPIRYRGYYYDEETGYYYLQSRYYDPETGRFINSDDIGYLGASGSLLSYNIYAYCKNAPVAADDPTGNGPILAYGIQFVVTINSVTVGIEFLWKASNRKCYLFGFVGGSRGIVDIGNSGNKAVSKVLQALNNVSSINLSNLTSLWTFGISASAVVVLGNSHASFPGSYCGWFTGVSVAFRNISISGAIAKSGRMKIGSLGIGITSSSAYFGFSQTYYFQLTGNSALANNLSSLRQSVFNTVEWLKLLFMFM